MSEYVIFAKAEQMTVDVDALPRLTSVQARDAAQRLTGRDSGLIGRLIADVRGRRSRVYIAADRRQPDTQAVLVERV